MADNSVNAFWRAIRAGFLRLVLFVFTDHAKKLGSGIIGLSVAVILYLFLTEFETTGGVWVTNWFFAILYNIGGKWILCSVCVLYGIVNIGSGIMEWIEWRRQSQSTTDDNQE